MCITTKEKEMCMQSWILKCPCFIHSIPKLKIVSSVLEWLQIRYLYERISLNANVQKKWGAWHVNSTRHRKLSLWIKKKSYKHTLTVWQSIIENDNRGILAAWGQQAGKPWGDLWESAVVMVPLLCTFAVISWNCQLSFEAVYSAYLIKPKRKGQDSLCFIKCQNKPSC